MNRLKTVPYCTLLPGLRQTAHYLLLVAILMSGPDAWAEENDSWWKRVKDRVSDRVEDAGWLTEELPEYEGLRHRIAVIPAQNRVAGEHAETVPMDGVDELLTTSLIQSGRFDVMERTNLDAVLAEQDRENLTPETAIEVGKLQGADYLVALSIHEWNPTAQSSGIDTDKLEIGRIRAEVGLTLRFIDTLTGQVVVSASERFQSSRWRFTIHDDDESLDHTREALVQKAVQAALNRTLFEAIVEFGDRPWKGTVIRVSEADNLIYINAGKRDGLQMGERLHVLRVSEEPLIDITTGLILDYEEDVIVEVTVQRVDERYSTAAPEGDPQPLAQRGIKKGDRVKRVEEVSPGQETPPQTAHGEAGGRGDDKMEEGVDESAPR